METEVCDVYARGRKGVHSLPKRNGNIGCWFAFTTGELVHSLPKRNGNLGKGSSSSGRDEFTAYLKGMETPPRYRLALHHQKFTAYLKGMETQIVAMHG